MTNAPVHIIGQSVIDLVIHNEDYKEIQLEAAELFKSGLSHSLNRLFDEVNAGSSASYLLQEVRIDLGVIDRKNFSKEFEKRLVEQLRKSLEKIIIGQENTGLDDSRPGIIIRSESDSRFELVKHFLLRGFMPWQAVGRKDASPEQLFKESINKEPLLVRQFLFRQGANEMMIKRIVFQLSEALVYSLIEILEPAEATFIIAYLEKLKGGLRRKKFVKKDPQQFEKVRLRVTLSYLLDRRDSHFNRKEFVRSTLHSVAQHYNIPYAEVLNWFIAVLEEEKELRESKSELAAIIREIAEKEPAIADIDESIELIRGNRPGRSFFETNVFIEGSNVVVLLGNDTVSRSIVSGSQDFREALREYLVNERGLKEPGDNVVVLYEDSILAARVRQVNKISIHELAVVIKYYIEKGYTTSKYVYGRRSLAKHLFSVWLRQYPGQFKKLLSSLIPSIEKKMNGTARQTNLYRALLLFFGDKAQEINSFIEQLFSLPVRHSITAYTSYYRQFLLVKTFQYNDAPTSITAYRKYMIAAIAREFRLSEKELEILLENNASSMDSITNEKFKDHYSSEPWLRPWQQASIAILDRMKDNSRGKFSLKEQGFREIGPVPSNNAAAKSNNIGDTPIADTQELLPAIEFYLLFSSLPWWYSHDLSTLREQLQLLIARKDRQLLALLLKHRTNGAFVNVLVHDLAAGDGNRFFFSLTGIQPDGLFRFYKAIYSFLKDISVPEQNAAIRFFDALVALIYRERSFDISRTDFISKLFRPLFNEKTPSRQRVEKLLVQLTLFCASGKGIPLADLAKRESFLKTLSIFFRDEYELSDETMAAMLGEQLGNMILGQYGGKMWESFDDTISILWEMKAIQPIHTAWIDELSAAIEPAISLNSLIKELPLTRHKRRSAWLLRGLLRRKHISFLQYARFRREEMAGAVSILLLQDTANISFIQHTETVFNTVASTKSSSPVLFWPIVLDYTIKRSAFNQKNLLYSLLSSFSQAGRISFYQLVADAIQFLQSAAYTGNRQPLLQLLFEIADDKKIMQLLNRQEVAIKPVAARQDAKKVPPPAVKKSIEEKKAMKPLLDEGESVYINNAGLVLINPFIKRLFDMQAYLDGNTFRSAEETTRAVHLLQFIASGLENTGEEYLFFNKILCGIDPLVTLEKTIELTTEEKEAAESLLSNIISNWPAMKNASFDGLRGSYFVRDGRLKTSEQGWKLVVEKKPYDILLNQLPWGFSTIKLPWMAKPVFVQWI